MSYNEAEEIPVYNLGSSVFNTVFDAEQLLPDLSSN
jgi:hypothetical protein